MPLASKRRDIDLDIDWSRDISSWMLETVALFQELFLNNSGGLFEIVAKYFSLFTFGLVSNAVF